MFLILSASISIVVKGSSLDSLQKEAQDYLELYTVDHLSVAGNPRTHWFIKSNCTEKAIKVTIKWTGRTKSWTQSYSMEPGSIKKLRKKDSKGRLAEIVGARFI